MVGRTVGNYRIVAELGAGGMGIVYKAQDARLERFLALKFLKPERVSDDFRRRFLQEARASSALHHPNIVHVYDIGEFEGMDYIAMEFVDGLSLRQTLRDRRLSVTEAARYSIQIADAMAAAHAAGIVHRDLKPGNLMVTPAGLIKILDFGLAKLASHPASASTPPDAAGQTGDFDPDCTLSVITLTSDHTQLGVAVGSPAFMSPEQAMGQPVDGRSDIFSFGSILYEMLTGRRAFAGDKTGDVISAVIRHQPPPPASLNPDVGPDLDALVVRTMRKQPAQRFQNMGEVKAALEEVMGGASGSFATGLPATARSRRPVFVIAAVAIAVIAPLTYLALRDRGAKTPAAPLEANRLTLDPGLNIDPAISADGKFVAYASDRSGEGNLDIWVRPIVEGSDPVRLTRDTADKGQPVFSPDGTRVAFRSERDGGAIYIVPAAGGDARKIIPEGRRPRFSPDGNQIAYWKGMAEPFPLRAGNGATFVYDLASGSTRQIAADFPAAVDPVWSPDGKSIVFIGLKDPSVLRTFDWWVVPLGGGTPVRCPVNTFRLLVPFAWRGDSILYEEGSGIGAKIGQVRIDSKTFQPIGTPANLTAGTTDEFSPSISRGGLLVFSGQTRNTNLYALPLDVNGGRALGPPAPLTRDLGENSVRSVSADGNRLVFLTRRPARDPAQVWVRERDSGREHALTAGGRDKNAPEISPDGSVVAWREAYARVTDVFVTPFEGGPAAKLCADCTGYLVWSPASDYALVQTASLRSTIGIADRATGRQSVYLEGPPGAEVRPRALSADGKWLAFTVHKSVSNYKICVAPFARDRPPPQTEWIEVALSADAQPSARWSPDGGLLYFGSTCDGYECLWAQRLNRRSKRPEGKPFAVEHFHRPTQVVEAPSFAYPLALGPSDAVVSITERVGGLWTLDLEAKR